MVKNNFKSLFLLLLQGTLIMPGHSQSNKESRVDSLLKKISADNRPGLVAIVIQKGSVVYQKGFGIADMDSHIQIDMRTIFYIGSLAKQFTAMAIELLADQNKLNYDDRIDKYLHGLPSYCDSVTIKQLLTHTSGLPDFYKVTDLLSGLTNSKAIELIRNEKPGFEPGKKWEYCNTNYVLLSEIIAKVSGMRYGEFIKKNIFQKTGMNSSYVRESVKSIPKKAMIAKGYSFSQNKISLLNYEGYTTGPGGIYSCGEDMVKWFTALSSKKIVSDSAYRLAWTQHVSLEGQQGIPRNSFYGFGWIITNTKNMRLIWHTGGMRGYKCSFTMNEQGTLAVILLSNFSEFEQYRLSLTEKIATIYMQE